MRRSGLRGGAATTAQASQVPKRPPISEVSSASLMLSTNADRYWGPLKVALKFDHVSEPSRVVNAPWTTS